MTSQLLTRLLVGSVITATVVIGIGPAATVADVDSSEPFDVVFLIDGSPSMEGFASETTANSVEFSRAIAEKRSDSRFAVAVYTDHRWTSLQRDFTSDIDELEAGLSSITYGRNSTENASGAILRTLDSDRAPVMSFRPSATPLIVVVTDEDDDGYCTVGQEAFGAVDRQDAVLVSVAPETPNDPGQSEPSCLTEASENDLDTIATEQVSTGYWVELATPDFSPVLEDIPESTPTPTPTATRTPTATATPTPTPTATPVPTPTPTETQSVTGVPSFDLEPARFELVNRSVEPTVATPGQPTLVRVVVKNHGMMAEPYVAVLSNGSEVLRRDRVLMGPGEVRSFEWNVTPVDTGNTTFYVNDAEVGTVEVAPASEGNATEGTPTETANATATQAQSTTTTAAASGGSGSLSTAVETPLASTPRPDQPAGQSATAAGLGYPAIIGLSAVGVITLVVLRRARRDL